MFDHVIVGAGSAGCVLAARLSADPGRKVLLIEAGGSDRCLEVKVPAAFSKLFKGPRDWAFMTEPEPQLDGRRLYIPRGKMLGGSSSMNAMIYIRGHRADYDGWRDAGCPGWGYDEVLPVFKRMEDQERGASAFHGTGGPVRVADLKTLNPITPAFLEAAVEGGFAANDDFNGTSQEGFGPYQVTQKNGRRWSAADAFLRPARRRPNLTVLGGALARRVLFDGRRARGVELVREGRVETVEAAAGVILAAGAIGSPHLLLLSGVGPAEVLERHGIPVVAELPGVGENFQDHPFAGAMFRARDVVTLDQASKARNLLLCLLGRGGPLSSNVAEAGGFVRTREDLPAPDLQFHYAPAFYLEHGFANPAGGGFSIGPTLLVPKSRGRLTLTSPDPSVPPRIEGRFLTEQADLETLVDGVEIARDLGYRKALDRYRGEEVIPGPDKRSREDLRTFVRGLVELLYHPVGTCRMGRDELAVVDPELRVQGVDGLRVIDASVMPTVTRGNTNAPTLMIAGRGADLVLGVTPPA